MIQWYSARLNARRLDTGTVSLLVPSWTICILLILLLLLCRHGAAATASTSSSSSSSSKLSSVFLSTERHSLVVHEQAFLGEVHLAKSWSCRCSRFCSSMIFDTLGHDVVCQLSKSRRWAKIRCRSRAEPRIGLDKPLAVVGVVLRCERVQPSATVGGVNDPSIRFRAKSDVSSTQGARVLAVGSAVGPALVLSLSGSRRSA